MTPLEETEQAQFVVLLEKNNLKFTAIPNNTYTKYMNQKVKNHRVGLRPGFSDMIVLVPPHRSIDGEGYFLCIEMKRLSGSSTSKDQKEWLEAITGLGVTNVQAYICKGCVGAVKVMKHYVKDFDDNIF